MAILWKKDESDLKDGMEGSQKVGGCPVRIVLQERLRNE